MENSIRVNVYKEMVGELARENNNYIFSYTQDAPHFISLTMPIRKEGYKNQYLHPIFEMNLPEGYLLSVIKKHFSKIAKTDDFGLLKLMSKSIQGRVTYNSNSIEKHDVLTLEDLCNPVSENLFEELVSRFALHSALSGVQPKVLAMVENKATLRYENYIVKSWGDEYPQLALNEYYCMLIAKYAGIIVPEFYISSDEKLFIMKRFDILDNGKKLGFEDMCVLQAKQRDDKYEGTYEKIAKTIKTFVSPLHKKSSLKQFYKILVVNNIIQNGDAHLKNFGLIYDGIEDIQLAPAYDIVSTTAYIKKDIPALHLLGSKKWWDKKYILKFGVENCELSKFQSDTLYQECVLAAQKVSFEIEKRVVEETDASKISLLKSLLDTINRK